MRWTGAVVFAALLGTALCASDAGAQTKQQQFQTALNGMGFTNNGTSSAPDLRLAAFVGQTSTAITAAETFAAQIRATMSASTTYEIVYLSSPVTASPQSQTQSNRAAAAIGGRNTDGSSVGLTGTAATNESALLLMTHSPAPYTDASAGSTALDGRTGGTCTLNIYAGQCGAAFAGAGSAGQNAAPTASSGQGRSGGRGGQGGAAVCQSTGASGGRWCVAVGGEGGDGGHATAAGASSGNESKGLDGGRAGDGGTASAVPGAGSWAVAYTRSGGDGGDGGYGSTKGGVGGRGGTAGLSLATGQRALAYHFATSAAGGGSGGDGGDSGDKAGDGGKGGAGGTAQANGDSSASASVFAQGGTGGAGGTGGDGGTTAGTGGGAGAAGTSSTSNSSLAAAIPGYVGTAGSGGSQLPGAQMSTDWATAALLQEQAQRVARARNAARSADR